MGAGSLCSAPPSCLEAAPTKSLTSALAVCRDGLVACPSDAGLTALCIQLGLQLEQPGGLRELTPTQERELRTACGLGEMAPVHGSALAPASAPAALGLMPECEPAQADAFSGATKPEGASALEEEGAGVAGASLLTSDV